MRAKKEYKWVKKKQAIGIELGCVAGEIIAVCGGNVTDMQGPVSEAVIIC